MCQAYLLNREVSFFQPTSVQLRQYKQFPFRQRFLGLTMHQGSDPDIGDVIRGLLLIGLAKTWGMVRYALMLSKTAWHCSSHSNGTSFFMSLEKGWHLLNKLEMNLLIYVKVESFEFQEVPQGKSSVIAFILASYTSNPKVELDNPSISNGPYDRPRNIGISLLLLWALNLRLHFQLMLAQFRVRSRDASGDQFFSST